MRKKVTMKLDVTVCDVLKLMAQNLTYWKAIYIYFWEQGRSVAAEVI